MTDRSIVRETGVIQLAIHHQQSLSIRSRDETGSEKLLSIHSKT